MEGILDPVRDGGALVHLRGNCDLYSAPKFKASILERIEAGRARILIDMSEIDYLDSTGVARSSPSSRPRGARAERCDSRA